MGQSTTAHTQSIRKGKPINDFLRQMQKVENVQQYMSQTSSPVMNLNGSTAVMGIGPVQPYYQTQNRNVMSINGVGSGMNNAQSIAEYTSKESLQVRSIKKQNYNQFNLSFGKKKDSLLNSKQKGRNGRLSSKKKSID